jgi:hypothetical protein
MKYKINSYCKLMNQKGLRTGLGYNSIRYELVATSIRNVESTPASKLMNKIAPLKSELSD